jgi:hypothetical protein
MTSCIVISAVDEAGQLKSLTEEGNYHAGQHGMYKLQQAAGFQPEL